MLRSMVVVRQRLDDCYNVTLELPEKEYFDIYEDLDKEAAEDIVKQYMAYHGDEARYSDVSIEHLKGDHIVAVNAKFHYDKNDHTEEFTIPHHLTEKTYKNI